MDTKPSPSRCSKRHQLTNAPTSLPKKISAKRLLLSRPSGIAHRNHSHCSLLDTDLVSHLQASTRTFNSIRPPSSALTLTRPSCSLVANCVVCHPTCSHSCLLQFHGFGVNSSGQGFVVTEFCERGSLRSVLKNPSIELQWAVRTRIALEVRTPVTYACDNTSDPLHALAWQ